MAPENRPSQREISIPTSPFQALCCFWGVFSIFLGRQGRFCAPPIVEMLPPPNDVFPKPLQATWEPWFRDLFCLEERNFVVLVDWLIQFWHCFLVPDELMNHQQTQSMWIIRSFQNNMYAFVRVMVWQTASLVKLLVAVFLPLNPAFQVWLSTQKSNSNLEICW